MILQVLSHRFFQSPNLSQAIFFLHGLLDSPEVGEKTDMDVSENSGFYPKKDGL